jgi:hypothetical protein
MSEMEMLPEDVRFPDRERDETLQIGPDKAGLEAQIKLVRELRIGLAEEKRLLDETRAIWERENRHTIEKVGQISKDLVEEEARLRELTLEAYEATGNKKPAEGVGVRIGKEFLYDAKAALTWAKKESPIFVLEVLDEKAFSAFAIQRVKAGHTIGDLKMELREVPQATISKEL